MPELKLCLENLIVDYFLNSVIIRVYFNLKDDTLKNLIISLLIWLPLTIHAEQVEKSWSEAVVYSPKKTNTKMNNFSIDGKFSSVILLHGCTGIETKEHRWARFISNLGFIVIMPDSMARPGRIPNCDPTIKGPSNKFPMAYQYRQEEINFAVGEIQKQKWYNGKIFLMGHSEGGIATALNNNKEINGFLISGWTCTHKRDPDFDGMRIPEDSPVLAVASINDHWRKNSPREGRCADKAQNHKNFTQVDLNDSSHDTSENASAREAVKKFLTTLDR